MRIGVITPGYPPQLGGVEQVVSSQCRELSRLGHEITVYTHRGPAARAAVAITPDGVRVQRFRSISGMERYPVAPTLWARLAREESGIDVLHAHSFHAIAAAGSAVLTSVPFVLTPHFHGGGHTWGARLMHVPYKPLAAMMFRRASAVICVSEAEASLLRRSFPGVAERVHVIPNGVAPLDFASVDPYPVARPVVLSCGRLESYKQVDLVMKAVASEDISCDLVVTGTGTESARLEALAGRLPAGERVSLLGRIPEEDLRRWQVTADVVVTLSRHEAFGLVLLEALAAGAAVVASDISAHREVVESVGASHLVRFVPVDTAPDAVRAAIVACLEDTRRAGDRSGISPPSWSEAVAKLDRLYQAVLLS